MTLKYQKRTFEIIITNHATRDGIGIELWENDKLKLEIYRLDDNREIQFTSYNCEIPLEILDKFLKKFDKEIGREFQ